MPEHEAKHPKIPQNQSSRETKTRGRYIRMARGENESGVEFQALAATVEPAADAPLHSFLEN